MNLCSIRFGKAHTLGFRICTDYRACRAAYPFSAVDHHVNIILSPLIQESPQDIIQQEGTENATHGRETRGVDTDEPPGAAPDGQCDHVRSIPRRAVAGVLVRLGPDEASEEGAS